MENGQHSNYNLPPKGCFIKAQSKGKAGVASGADEKSLTPSKVAQLRSTYIQQIKELHELIEVGAITNEHFINPFAGGVMIANFTAWAGVFIRVTMGRDPMTPLGLYVERTLPSRFESRSGQRRVVTVRLL